MKVFIAGSINNCKSIKEVMKAVEFAGYEVVHDWTEQFDERKNQEYCLNDLEGVKKCDIFVACVENCHGECKGTLIEIGIALALDKTVVVIGEIKSIYMFHPNVTMFPNMSCHVFMNNCESILGVYNKQEI